MDAAGQGEHQTDGRVGHFFAAVVRHIGHGDAPLAGQDVIDVVVAHAATARSTYSR